MGNRRARTILQHPDTELVCVMDNDEKEAESIAREAGCPYYTNFKKVFTHDNMHCVVVSTPNKLHAPMAVTALKYGKHVFCEKPLARTPEEALLMVKTALKNKVFLKTGSNLRYFPSVQKAKELIDSNAIGELLFLRGWIGNSGEHLKNSWFSNYEMTGGGTFLDNGCHVLDLTRFFLGEVEECTGFVTTAYWAIRPLEDNGFGVFKTMDGKMAFIQSSWTEWAGYMYMETYGTDGCIRIDNRDDLCKTILRKRDGFHTVFDYSLQPPQSYWLEFQDFVKAICEGRQPLPSGYDGMRAVQMAHGLYQSSRMGKAVRIFGKVEKELSMLTQPARF